MGHFTIIGHDLEAPPASEESGSDTPALTGLMTVKITPVAEEALPIGGLSVVKASTRRALSERLERARDHLHAHPDRAVTLAELAHVVGVSQFHLARYFRRAFGSAPIAYHRALRLERAARLLETGKLPLSEVAELTGYSDEVALSHAFRRRFGQPPQLWAAARRSA